MALRESQVEIKNSLFLDLCLSTFLMEPIYHLDKKAAVERVGIDKEKKGDIMIKGGHGIVMLSLPLELLSLAFLYITSLIQICWLNANFILIKYYIVIISVMWEKAKTIKNCSFSYYKCSSISKVNLWYSFLLSFK